MPIGTSKDKDYKPLSVRPVTGADPSRDQPSLRPSGAEVTGAEPTNLVNLSYSFGEKQPVAEAKTESGSEVEEPRPIAADATVIPSGQASSPKAAKQIKREERDKRLLSSDRWLVRNGHLFTFVALYLFSIMVLYRPYETVPGLGFLSGTAIYFGLITLALYFPSQLAVEGNLTIFPTEVKAILAMLAISMITMPIAKDPALAWETFNEPFSKAVIMFIVMINVVRTRKRLMAMMWLSLGIGIYLAIAALDLYSKGKFAVEEYRIAVDIGGLFGNPNEMALHFVMMTPLAITLGIAARSKIWRILYFAVAGLFIAANMVTFSRGGFIGLIACSAVLAWKLGRKYRLNVTLVSLVVGVVALAAAPGNYGLRMLSIFIPGLDAVGSSDQRKELLIRSIWTSIRNPWGIGLGNFPIVGVRNLQSHNAFTQVSSELGILGLIAYLVFMISPFRKLGAIERKLFDSEDANWYYYLAIGLQASIIGYMVSSFFASVAYQWFIYYLIAYAVAFRRTYSLEAEKTEQIAPQMAVQPA